MNQFGCHAGHERLGNREACEYWRQKPAEDGGGGRKSGGLAPSAKTAAEDGERWRSEASLRRRYTVSHPGEMRHVMTQHSPCNPDTPRSGIPGNQLFHIQGQALASMSRLAAMASIPGLRCTRLSSTREAINQHTAPSLGHFY